MEKFLVGRDEWIELPDLEIPLIKAKIDSGAKTSSLYAFNMVFYKDGDANMIKFDVHPVQNNRKILRSCKAEVIDYRIIKSSSGEMEKRPVILSRIKMGDQIWPIELTLSINRHDMGYRMLLGREAMQGRILVDPDETFLIKNYTDNEVIESYNSPIINNKDSLRIILLASDKTLYSNARILKAARELGHEIEFINVRHCYLTISGQSPAVYYRGKPIEGIDAIIPRFRPSVTSYGCAVLRQFRVMGVFCLNDENAISCSRDKLRSFQLLANNKDIKMPITGFANLTEHTKHLIKIVGGAPVVIKLPESTQGAGVVLAETNKAAESVINAFKSLKEDILIQEFIGEAKGSDIRCFVIDGKVVGAMKRKAVEGDFRANLHLGGTAEIIKLSKEEKGMAISATEILGLRVAGVDIITTKDGPKILEVNSSPGLQGIEKVTNKDIASLMINCIEKYVLGKKYKDKKLYISRKRKIISSTSTSYNNQKIG